MHLTSLQWLVVLFVANRYLLRPVSLHGHLTDVTRRSRAMTPADESRIDPVLLAYLVRAEGDLGLMGFLTPRRIVFSDTQHMLTVASIAERQGDIATVMAIRSLKGKQAAVSAVTIICALNDGRTLATSNVPGPRRVPLTGHSDSLRMPVATGLVELDTMHRFLRSELDLSPNVLTLGATMESALAYVDADTATGYDRWVASGEFHRLPGALRRTWKGAYGFVWRGMFPWRQLNDLANARKLARARARQRAAGVVVSQVWAGVPA